MNDQELQQLKEIQMKQLGGMFVTPKELVALMKVIVEKINKLKNQIETQATRANDEIGISRENILTDVSKSISDIENKIEMIKDDVKRHSSKEIENIQNKITRSINELKEHVSSMPDMDVFENKLKDIETKILGIPEQFNNKLETLKENLEDEMRKIKEGFTRVERVASQSRSGGTSSAGVAFAFKSIAHTEEPVGAIDGVNTTYLVDNNIWWIFGFTLNGEQIAELPNFTYVNKTITFSSALPAVYSGKDFEVKYIGT